MSFDNWPIGTIGSPEEWSELIGEYVTYRKPDICEPDLDDITHDVLVWLAERADDICDQARSNPKGYVFKSMQQQVRHRMTPARQRRSLDTVSLHDDLAFLQLDAACDFRSEVLNDLLIDVLCIAPRVLKPREFAVFRLHVECARNEEEISDQLGLSVKHIQRVLKKCQEKLLRAYEKTVEKRETVR